MAIIKDEVDRVLNELAMMVRGGDGELVPAVAGGVSPNRMETEPPVRGNEPLRMSTNSSNSGNLGAYDTAKNGGRHSGFYRNYLNKPTEQIQKGIQKIQRQIEEHQNLISDPKKYLSEYGKGDWDTLDPRQQRALVTKKWPSDIQRQREQQDILKGILEERQ